jgi:hypothetical protein
MTALILALWALSLLSIIAVTAIWSEDPSRRTGAREVLRIILSTVGRRRV